MDLLSKNFKNCFVKGLPNLKFEKDKICDACQFGKQVKSSFKPKIYTSTIKPLQLLHMDLFGPSRTASLGGKHYAFVIVYNFSRFTWVIFLSLKEEVLKTFKYFCKKVENEKGYSISTIRSDHSGEFDNVGFDDFCKEHGYEHNFSAPRTSQQNGVVERKNRTLQEMTRSMLNENNLPKFFWAEAINTACYIINRVFVSKRKTKTPYEL
ncbi:Retrovirus-related Pol poly from transposon TNT 1-94 [Olea europaea subsp. europaea]|uniref:Retrovirus-related Pol poly from transposon TNT 1-94, partial n=1 Tax=Olea europaea subsp. europaea TaxID=158383 RepID=A0A8S0RJL7_OLEEU|nr:Retrovirus-related Pol poly from transposon TNT 1-94 [Olea europaea subsp. europaea]